MTAAEEYELPDLKIQLMFASNPEVQLATVMLNLPATFTLVYEMDGEGHQLSIAGIPDSAEDDPGEVISLLLEFVELIGDAIGGDTFRNVLLRRATERAEASDEP